MFLVIDHICAANEKGSPRHHATPTMPPCRDGVSCGGFFFFALIRPENILSMHFGEIQPEPCVVPPEASYPGRLCNLRRPG